MHTKTKISTTGDVGLRARLALSQPSTQPIAQSDQRASPFRQLHHVSLASVMGPLVRQWHGTTVGSSASAARCSPGWGCGVKFVVGDGWFLALPVGLAVEDEFVGG